MAAPTTITEWFQRLPIVWLTQNTNGAADAAAQGQVYDEQVDLIKQAVEARMPDFTPADGLPYVGNNCGLIQGYAESDDTFRARCKAAWDQWALAGTWAEVLFQLFFTCGLPSVNTYIVQQNGLAYSLTEDPTATTDPTTILQIDELGLNPNITPPDSVPWWTFDDRNDLTARFAIVVNNPVPPSLCIVARATFASSSTATATWGYPMDGIDYLTAMAVTTTDSTNPIVTVDTKARDTVSLSASGAFTGYVDLIGWESGQNPFAGGTASLRNLITLIANRWKPAKAKFMGTIVCATGVLWGFPVGTTWGQAGLAWGDSLGARLEP